MDGINPSGTICDDFVECDQVFQDLAGNPIHTIDYGSIGMTARSYAGGPCMAVQPGELTLRSRGCGTTETVYCETTCSAAGEQAQQDTDLEFLTVKQIIFSCTFSPILNSDLYFNNTLLGVVFVTFQRHCTCKMLLNGKEKVMNMCLGRRPVPAQSDSAQGPQSGRTPQTPATKQKVEYRVWQKQLLYTYLSVALAPWRPKLLQLLFFITQ